MAFDRQSSVLHGQNRSTFWYYIVFLIGHKTANKRFIKCKFVITAVQWHRNTYIINILQNNETTDTFYTLLLVEKKSNLIVGKHDNLATTVPNMINMNTSNGLKL